MLRCWTILVLWFLSLVEQLIKLHGHEDVCITHFIRLFVEKLLVFSQFYERARKSAEFFERQKISLFPSIYYSLMELLWWEKAISVDFSWPHQTTRCQMIFLIPNEWNRSQLLQRVIHKNVGDIDLLAIFQAIMRGMNWRVCLSIILLYVSMPLCTVCVWLCKRVLIWIHDYQFPIQQSIRMGRCECVRRKRVIMNLILIFCAPFFYCDALKFLSERSKKLNRSPPKSKAVRFAHFNNQMRQIDWNHHQRLPQSSQFDQLKCPIFINQSSNALYTMPSDFKLQLFFFISNHSRGKKRKTKRRAVVDLAILDLFLKTPDRISWSLENVEIWNLSVINIFALGFAFKAYAMRWWLLLAVGFFPSFFRSVGSIIRP